MRGFPLLLLGLVSCSSEPEPWHAPAPSIVLDSPEYASFHGDEAVLVKGRVDQPMPLVLVEGQQVLVRVDGSFEAHVNIDGPWNIIEVEAFFAGQRARERVPVFSGQHPLHTWSGGVSLRLGPEGYDHLGVAMGQMIDDTGWSDALYEALPALETGTLDVVPTGITHAPTVVELEPAIGGMETAISFMDIDLLLAVEIPDWGVSVPVSVGYDRVDLTAFAIPEVDDYGIIWITLTDPELSMEDPDVSVAGVEGPALDLLLAGVALLVEPLGELLLGWVMDEYGVFELGGPFTYQGTVLGTDLALALTDLFADLSGLGGELTMSFGEGIPTEPAGVPVPYGLPPGADAAVGLHEGLLQLVVDDVVLSQLSQEIELGGSMGELLGSGITNLPGGDDAPEEDGWCIAMEPGEAWVTRLQPGLRPLARLYLLDLHVDIGVLDGDACKDWLEAELAVELGLEVSDGTKLGVEVEVVEGAVLAYGADPEEWAEDEVIEGLGVFLESVMGLLAGSLELDLAGFIGGGMVLGPLGEVSPEIVGSEALEAEGLYAVSLSLWD